MPEYHLNNRVNKVLTFSINSNFSIRVAIIKKYRRRFRVNRAEKPRVDIKFSSVKCIRRLGQDSRLSPEGSLAFS